MARIQRPEVEGDAGDPVAGAVEAARAQGLDLLAQRRASRARRRRGRAPSRGAAASTATLRWATKPGQGAFTITRAPAATAISPRAVRRAGVHDHDLVAEGDALAGPRGSFSSSLWVMTTAERGTTGEVYPRERDATRAPMGKMPSVLVDGSRQASRISWLSSRSAAPFSKATSCCLRACTRRATCSARASSWIPSSPRGWRRSLADALRPHLGGRGAPAAVVAPALGGVLVAHEVARAFGCRGLFTERQDGRMTLRRGFRLEPGEPVVVVEDVITTGGSTREVMDAVRDARRARPRGGQPRGPQRRRRRPGRAPSLAPRPRGPDLSAPRPARSAPRAGSPRSPARAPPRGDALPPHPRLRRHRLRGLAVAGARRPARTVQGALEAALARLRAASAWPWLAAGRTDAGVHALGQVVSFDLPRDLAPDVLARALNGLLPADVRVLDAAPACPTSFTHAATRPPSSTATCWTRGRCSSRRVVSTRPTSRGPWPRSRCRRRPPSTSAATTSRRSRPPAAPSRPRSAP